MLLEFSNWDDLPSKYGKPSKYRTYGELTAYDFVHQGKGLAGMRTPMKKYIAGQRLLAAILGYEISPLTIAKHPNEVYRDLSKAGIVYDAKRFWRFDGRSCK